MHTFTLDNGLRAVVEQRHGTAMAALTVLYDTGSRDETRARTGMAHLFEHIMFGGTPDVPDYSHAMQLLGGTDNASTSPDYTLYWEVMPAGNLDQAIALEADRLRNISFDPRVLGVQRNVVVEEFRLNYLNRPYGDLSHILHGLAYSPEHPYSWPTIGLEPSHITDSTDGELRQWFRAHYAPATAVVAVSSPLDPAQVEESIRAHFGGIEARPTAQRALPAPGFPDANIIHTVRAKVPVPRVVTAIPMAPYGTDAYYAADAITDILSLGKSGIFNKELVCGDSSLFTGADASIEGTEGPGLLLLDATITEATEAAAVRARDMMTERIARLADPANISPDAMTRTLNQSEAGAVFSLIAPRERAARAAKATMRGVPVDHDIIRRRAITPSHIARTAARLADTPSVSVIYLPA